MKLSVINFFFFLIGSIMITPLCEAFPLSQCPANVTVSGDLINYVNLASPIYAKKFSYCLFIPCGTYTGPNNTGLTFIYPGGSNFRVNLIGSNDSNCPTVFDAQAQNFIFSFSTLGYSTNLAFTNITFKNAVGGAIRVENTVVTSGDGISITNCIPPLYSTFFSSI